MDNLPLSSRLNAVLTRIHQAHAESPAACLGEVTLILASKAQPLAVLNEALALGHRHFGENRLQEAAEKWPALKAAHPDIVLHFIGALQSNKAEEAVTLCDAIHSLDRPSLAQALARAMDKTGRRVPCFIQVNTGEEPQKGGIAPAEAPEFIRQCREEWGLPIVGLMCVPPVDVPPAPHFALLRQLAAAQGLAALSMGMTDDYDTAIRLGATHVRVGRAVFGERV